MAYRVEVSARARRDLDAIYEFIQAEESDHALTWFLGLAEALRSLSELPYRSPVTPDDPNRRHLFYGHKPHVYRVIYRIDEPSRMVRIITVRHGARRPLRSST